MAWAGGEGHPGLPGLAFVLSTTLQAHRLVSRGTCAAGRSGVAERERLESAGASDRRPGFGFGVARRAGMSAVRSGRAVRGRWRSGAVSGRAVGCGLRPARARSRLSRAVRSRRLSRARVRSPSELGASDVARASSRRPGPRARECARETYIFRIRRLSLRSPRARRAVAPSRVAFARQSARRSPRARVEFSRVTGYRRPGTLGSAKKENDPGRRAKRSAYKASFASHNFRTVYGAARGIFADGGGTRNVREPNATRVWGVYRDRSDFKNTECMRG